MIISTQLPPVYNPGRPMVPVVYPPSANGADSRPSGADESRAETLGYYVHQRDVPLPVVFERANGFVVDISPTSAFHVFPEFRVRFIFSRDKLIKQFVESDCATHRR